MRAVQPARDPGFRLLLVLLPLPGHRALVTMGEGVKMRMDDQFMDWPDA